MFSHGALPEGCLSLSLKPSRLPISDRGAMHGAALSARQCRHEALSRHLIEVLAAPIGKDHHAEPSFENDAHIGRGIVETAGLVHDHRAAEVVDLPSER